MAANDASYTLIQSTGALFNGPEPTQQDLKNALESPHDSVKIETMKKILLMMLNGDSMPGLLMHVIRFVMPTKNKTLKKLLLTYWEICPKYNGEGANAKLKQEMILVCNAIRLDLMHPNEYLRGYTLRFLTKFVEPTLLEPLVPPARQSLEHKHPYVRKNAVLGVLGIYKRHEFLIPDAPELVLNLLERETDEGVKRNALWMLIQICPERVTEYFLRNIQSIINGSEDLQLCALEMVRKSGPEKAKFIKLIFELLSCQSHAVKYDAANTLVSLTSHSSAIKAANKTYIELLLKSADNNVKLIVLSRLESLIQQFEAGDLEEGVMDILRVLVSPDMAVRRKALSIVLDVVSSKSVHEVAAFLQKELVKTMEGDYEKSSEYRQLLIQTIHALAVKHPSTASDTVHSLLEFIGDQPQSAVDVVAFVREAISRFPNLRSGIVKRLLAAMPEVRTGRVFRGVLWLIGEYSQSKEEIEQTFVALRGVLGEIPLVESERRLIADIHGGNEENSSPSSSTPNAAGGSSGRKILADGTYATESALSQKRNSLTKLKESSRPPLRQLLLNGDFYLGGVVGNCVTKIWLKYESLEGMDPRRVNELRVEAMLIITSILRLGKSDLVTNKIDNDAAERLGSCLKVLGGVGPEGDRELVRQVFMEKCGEAWKQVLESEKPERRSLIEKPKTKSSQKKTVQCDDVIVFGMLKGKNVMNDVSNFYDMDLSRATGGDEKTGEGFVSKLNRVVQLTGFSDTLYAEAYVTVHQYDILLDVLIVNQTDETMQNLTLEFSTLGDLKLVERPQPVTLGPRGYHSIKANIKVSSTETGVIFGTLVYDGAHANDSHTITLYDIHIDIMDYIKPSYVTEQQFRTMWTEFEWENKVNVNTNMTDLRKYLDYVMKVTNMACLTPEHALSGECGFLAANLAARSIFGEDALANVCLEKVETTLPNGTTKEAVTGHIRIRSKTQGIALSLGDKITISQKSN